MIVPLSCPVIIGKATEIVQLMNINFVPTLSWLEKFKQWREITFRVISGEVAAALKEEAQHWASDALQKILGRYTPADIYNVNETKLFLQCLLIKTLRGSQR